MNRVTGRSDFAPDSKESFQGRVIHHIFNISIALGDLFKLIFVGHEIFQ
jgi:hypothetical protein